MKPQRIGLVEVFPILIREGVTVRFHGIPYDMTPAEADKICRVIKALGGESHDT